MEKFDALIIGGSAAGISAAMTARNGTIPKQRWPSSGRRRRCRCRAAFPTSLGRLGSSDKNLIPDKAVTGNGAELILDEVTALDRKAHTVTTAGGRDHRLREAGTGHRLAADRAADPRPRPGERLYRREGRRLSRHALAKDGRGAGRGDHRRRLYRHGDGRRVPQAGEPERHRGRAAAPLPLPGL